MQVAAGKDTADQVAPIVLGYVKVVTGRDVMTIAVRCLRRPRWCKLVAMFGHQQLNQITHQHFRFGFVQVRQIGTLDVTENTAVPRVRPLRIRVNPGYDDLLAIT
jgi:hypothetical protein